MSDATGTPDILRQAPAGRVVLWTSEVATLAGVTPMTVTRWARSGRLAASTTAGGNRRYAFAAVAELLADLGRPVPWWLNAAAEAERRAGGEDLAQLSQDLSTLADWFGQDCTSRHAEDMAAIVRRAWRIIDDLADATQGLGGP